MNIFMIVFWHRQGMGNLYWKTDAEMLSMEVVKGIEAHLSTKVAGPVITNIIKMAS